MDPLLFLFLAVAVPVVTFTVGYNAPDWMRAFRERRREVVTETPEQLNADMAKEWDAEYTDALADNGILAVLPGEPQPVRPFFLSSNTAFRYGDVTPTMYTLARIYEVGDQFLTANEGREIRTEVVRK